MIESFRSQNHQSTHNVFVFLSFRFLFGLKVFGMSSIFFPNFDSPLKVV
jgi:hypothetical protein